jgi:hypothetical protein
MKADHVGPSYPIKPLGSEAGHKVQANNDLVSWPAAFPNLDVRDKSIPYERLETRDIPEAVAFKLWIATLFNCFSHLVSLRASVGKGQILKATDPVQSGSAACISVAKVKRRPSARAKLEHEAFRLAVKKANWAAGINQPGKRPD